MGFGGLLWFVHQRHAASYSIPYIKDYFKSHMIVTGCLLFWDGVSEVPSLFRGLGFGFWGFR